MSLNFVKGKLNIKGFENIEKCMPDRPGIKFELFG